VLARTRLLYEFVAISTLHDLDYSNQHHHWHLAGPRGGERSFTAKIIVDYDMFRYPEVEDDGIMVILKKNDVDRVNEINFLSQ
jgi:hypothetical protein